MPQDSPQKERQIYICQSERESKCNSNVGNVANCDLGFASIFLLLVSLLLVSL